VNRNNSRFHFWEVGKRGNVNVREGFDKKKFQQKLNQISLQRLKAKSK